MDLFALSDEMPCMLWPALWPNNRRRSSQHAKGMDAAPASGHPASSPAVLTISWRMPPVCASTASWIKRRIMLAHRCRPFG